MATATIPTWIKFPFIQWVIYCDKLDNKIIGLHVLKICYRYLQVGELMVPKRKQIFKELIENEKKMEKNEFFPITKNDRKIAKKLIEILSDACDETLRFINKASDFGKLGAKKRWKKQMATPMGSPLGTPLATLMRTPMAKYIYNKGRCAPAGPHKRPAGRPQRPSYRQSLKFKTPDRMRRTTLKT